MVTYLWIALGGALGSMARAAVAIGVTRLTGPQFPWGTILINIVGSFVIGFFGTLTVSDGRFSVPTDLRAFVMIGICGGFTTFSSFSLQTLDLVRDGRPMQALCNVGLSVVLCLLAVTAGHYSAAGVHPAPRSAAVSGASGIGESDIGGSGMGEVVVAVLNRPAETEGLMHAAATLLDLGGGRLKAVAVRLPPSATILPSEEVLTTDRAASVRADQLGWAAAHKAVVDAWAPGASGRGIRIEWIDVEGDAATTVADHGRRADAVVVSRPVPHESEHMRHGLHAALFDTDRPVLLVPPGFHGALGRVVAVAWKNDERAAKALHSSLPLLARAAAVHVLSAHRAAELPAILQEHDIPASLHTLPDTDHSVGEQLLQVAQDLGADLLVMGAYAHGEWRETVFGGVTRTVLARASMPVLMRH